jgi:hypothetical protein
MAKPTGRLRASLLLFFTASVCAAGAAGDKDARLSLFDAYNHAQTYDAIKPLVSGVLARQYAAIASQDAQQLQQVLTQQQLLSYRPRLVDIDAATSFLVLEDVMSKSNQATSARAYLVSKNRAGDWTLADSMMPDSVLKTLWTTRFTPTDFAQPTSCSIDGKDIRPQSALAIRQKDTIQVTLYPFTFSQADLDYWRETSGMTVNADAAAGNHFEHKSVVCRLVVKIDNANHASLLNVGFDDPTGALQVSKLWQPSKADVSALALDRGTINLVTAGTLGTDKDGLRWNVRIRVPVWEKGL